MASPLTEKVGPLPAVAWAGIAVGGYLVLHYLRGKSVTSVGQQVSPTDIVDAADPYGSGDTSSVPYTGSAGGLTGPYSPPNPVSITTNQQWARMGADSLMGMGEDPSLVQTALANYLTGQPLTAAMQGIINQVLTRFGSPPEGVVAAVSDPTPIVPTPPVPVAPKPTPSPTVPAPVKPRTYTVKSGDSLWKIAQLFYGNAMRWPDIFHANASQIHNPNLIYPGQVLVIP